MNALTVALGLVFAIMVLALGVAWLMRQSLFSLSAISVQGDVTHNNAVTLRANVAPHLTGNFFTVDLGRTRSATNGTRAEPYFCPTSCFQQTIITSPWPSG